MSLDETQNRATSVDVEITESEVIDFRCYHLTRSPTLRRMIVLLISVILLAWCGWLALMLSTSAKPLEDAIAISPLLAGPPLFLIFFLGTWRWRMRRLSRTLLREGKNKSVLGKKRIALTSQGVSETGESSSFSARWDAVEKIISTDSSLFIYVSSSSAIIVPARAFASRSDFDAFISEARDHKLRASAGASNAAPN